MTLQGSSETVGLVLSRLKKVRRSGDGWVALCPAHSDRHHSLSIGCGRDGQVLLHCHAGCEFDVVVAGLGVEFEDLFPNERSERRPGEPHVRAEHDLRGSGDGAGRAFTREDARAVWERARSRALDDEVCHEDQDVYDFLRRRELPESWEMRAFGILSQDPGLPEVVRWWPDAGYRLIVPLYDGAGRVTCIQARAVRPLERKVMFPARSRPKGTMFASPSGLNLLRGTGSSAAVVLAEGLTDFLALSIVNIVPLLASPGAGMAVTAIGGWVKGQTLFVATDVDSSGERVVADVARRAYEQGADRVVRLVWPSGCADACDVVARVGVTGLEDHLDTQIRRFAR